MSASFVRWWELLGGRFYGRVCFRGEGGRLEEGEVDERRGNGVI